MISESLRSIEIFLSCTGLHDKDFFGKSDPYVTVFQRKLAKDQWEKVEKTETIHDNLNPDFVKPIRLVYNFEVPLYLRFVVKDDDGKLDESDILGQCETTVGDIVSAPGGVLTVELFNKKGNKGKKGHLIVRYKQILHQSNEFITMKWSADLKQKGMFGLDKLLDKFDPYLRISKQRTDGSFQQIYQSEHLENNLHPSWEEIDMELQKFCNGTIKKLMKQ